MSVKTTFIKAIMRYKTLKSHIEINISKSNIKLSNNMLVFLDLNIVSKIAGTLFMNNIVLVIIY